MDIIKAYKISDDRIFENKREASRAQKFIDMENELITIVEEFFIPDMDVSDIVDAILEDRVPILKVLK